ncbi:MAG: type II toxin-antitoxin system HigB family toxin [Paludibacter sp.]
MRIVTIEAIKVFIKKQNSSDKALREWYTKSKKSDWTCFADVKQTFNSADSVGNNRFVFNIKGNDFRLVAMIIFASKKIYIRFIGTHKEYDKIDCSNI